MKLAKNILVGLSVTYGIHQTHSAFVTNAAFINSKISTTAETKRLNYADAPYFLSEISSETETQPNEQKRKSEENITRPTNTKQSAKASKHQEGVFSPIVLAAKFVLGDQSLNKVRAKAISLHSDVIGKFVDTSDTPFGRAALTKLFQVADRNGDGVLEKDEIAEAVRVLGFSWLGEKQVAGIVKRADTDNNGAIDFEEFEAEAPRTLRNNLVKLAKKNGGDMGLLV